MSCFRHDVSNVMERRRLGAKNFNIVKFPPRCLNQKKVKDTWFSFPQKTCAEHRESNSSIILTTLVCRVHERMMLPIFSIYERPLLPTYGYFGAESCVQKRVVIPTFVRFLRKIQVYMRARPFQHTEIPEAESCVHKCVLIRTFVRFRRQSQGYIGACSFQRSEASGGIDKCSCVYTYSKIRKIPEEGSIVHGRVPLPTFGPFLGKNQVYMSACLFQHSEGSEGSVKYTWSMLLLTFERYRRKSQV